jgi:hypothetical protein
VYLTITYVVTAYVRFVDKGLIKDEFPFYIQVPRAGREAIDNFVFPKKKNFMVLSEDIKGDKNKIPSFKIRGEL